MQTTVGGGAGGCVAKLRTHTYTHSLRRSLARTRKHLVLDSLGYSLWQRPFREKEQSDIFLPVLTSLASPGCSEQQMDDVNLTPVACRQTDKSIYSPPGSD